MYQCQQSVYRIMKSRKQLHNQRKQKWRRTRFSFSFPSSSEQGLPLLVTLRLLLLLLLLGWREEGRSVSAVARTHAAGVVVVRHVLEGEEEIKSKL